jgi:DNA ligase D-like protein (predicted polymerase)
LPKASTTIEIGAHEVTITNPDKVYFPKLGLTKLDLVRYYESVAEGALRGIMRRPMVLKRFVNGAEEEPFFQKRAPANLPPWIDTARVTFPSGRFADLVVPDEPADLLWAINLGCIDLNPWPVRADDVDHPDELRIDLDPTPDANFGHVKETAMLFQRVLEEYGYRGFAKTSGSRGIHIYVRIQPKWEFPVLRRAGLALAREVERRAPHLVTTKWWKEERHGVFIDYNQNARDRTIASAFLRPPDAGRARLLPGRLGRAARCRVGRLHGCHCTQALRRARRRHGGDRRRGFFAGSADRADGEAGGGGAGRRTLAAAVPQSRWGAEARAAIARTQGHRHGVADRPPPVDSPADHGGEGSAQGRGAGRPRALEGAPSGGRGAVGPLRRPRGLDARHVLDLDAHPRQLAQRP